MKHQLADFLDHLRLNENASAHTVRAYESDLTQFITFVAVPLRSMNCRHAAFHGGDRLLIGEGTIADEPFHRRRPGRRCEADYQRVSRVSHSLPYHGDLIHARHRPLTQYREETWLHSTRSPSTSLWCLAPHPCLFIKCCGFGRGAIIELDASEEDAVSILANNLPVAKGTVVVNGNRIAVNMAGTAAAPPGHALMRPPQGFVAARKLSLRRAPAGLVP